MEDWTNDSNVKDVHAWCVHEITVKPVFSGHSKMEKTKVLKTNGSLMKVESIAEFCISLTCIKR